MSITEGYAPPNDFSRIEIAVDFELDGIVYQSKSLAVTAEDIASLWTDGGLTIPADVTITLPGRLAALVVVRIFSTEKGGTSKQIVVDT